jgi:hypothetical protein
VSLLGLVFVFKPSSSIARSDDLQVTAAALLVWSTSSFAHRSIMVFWFFSFFFLDFHLFLFLFFFPLMNGSVILDSGSTCHLPPLHLRWVGTRGQGAGL